MGKRDKTGPEIEGFKLWKDRGVWKVIINTRI
jgi:hypothetical protein